MQQRQLGPIVGDETEKERERDRESQREIDREIKGKKELNMENYI